MTRYIRNTVALVKLEGTPGTDSLPVGASDAVLIAEIAITPLDAQIIERKNIKGYFGGDAELIGPVSVKCSITIELSGSGTAGTAPPWAPMYLACANSEGVLATPARVEYTPASTGLKTVSMYYYDDGVLHKMLGTMGAWTLTAKVGERPMLKMDFIGVDGGVSAVSNAVPTLTSWKAPVPMTKANVVDITLGSTYALGAITGGTVYPSRGLEITSNNEVNFDANLSAESVDITDRNPTGSFELELTAAQEVAMTASVKANTLQSMALTIGLTSGYKIIVFAPAMQMKNPKKVDVKGKRYIGYDLRFLPLVGNDEVRLVLP